MDQISFPLRKFPQFSLDCGKSKVLRRTYSHIFCSGHFPNCPIAIMRFDLFQLNHDGRISHISSCLLIFCNQSKLYEKSFCNWFVVNFPLLFVYLKYTNHKKKEITHIGSRSDIENFPLRM